MTQYNHLSFDIETLDVKESAVVLSIGAVLFNIEEKDSFDSIGAERVFYSALEVQPQIDAGRTISGETIKWWMGQGAAAKKVFTEKAYAPTFALLGLSDFIYKTGPMYAWGNGNMFDNIIIRSLYESFEKGEGDHPLVYPFKFWSDMDLRTLQFLAGAPQKPKIEMVAHNALDDAKYQAICAQHYHGFVHGSKT